MAEIRCPRCGSRMILPMTKEDDLRHYVCSNRPTCTEKIAVEDAWSYMWEEGNPAGTGAGGIQQSEKSSQRRARTAVSRLEEGKLRLELIFRRSKRKRKAPVDEVRDADRGRGIHAPNQLPYQPQHKKMREIQAVSEVKETSEPRPPVVPGTADGRPRQRIKKASLGREDGWGDDWDDEIPAPSSVVHRPRLRRSPQAASREPGRVKMREVTHDKPEQPGALEKEAAVERKESLKTQPMASPEKQIVPDKKTEIFEEKKPFRHWWQRLARVETALEAKEPPKTRQKGAPADEFSAKKEEPPSHEWPRAPIDEVPLRKEEHAGPWPQVVSKREGAPQTEESLRPQPGIAPKPEMISEVKESLKPRPRPQAEQKKAVSTKRKKPFRRWWQRVHEKDVATREKELSKSRPQAVLKKEAAPEKKESPVPVRQATEVPLAVPEIKESDKPIKPIAPKVYGTDRAKESLKPQPLKVTQSDLYARKKKRVLPLIIIALVVASIAIDVMILAFVLR